jgi:ABC-type cobalamin/Fe3+-siderophores transport system ATPase subunit
MLRVSNVGWRARDVTILEDVSFEIARGEFVALMGRNGAGKSTLLDITAGLRKATRGVVVLEGRPLHTWPTRDLSRTVTHLPQAVRLDVAFSGEQLVAMGRYPHSAWWIESSSDRRIVEWAMDRCGCREFRTRRLGTLSGGERQRVLLAACLAQEPQLLLLDEPATFLDVDQQLQCFRLLREEAGRGVTCIAVTHDINLALTFCTRLLVLAERTLARDLSIEAALENPEWLDLFSARLEMRRDQSGHAWVSYA